VLGSAGGPRHALPLLTEGGAGSTCLIVNGDTLTDVNLRAMVDQHRRSGALVTMALIPNPRPDKYGGVLLDADGAVTGFSRRGSAETSLHFIGPQVIEAEPFMRLEDGVASESVLGLYPQLMTERPGSVRGFVCDSPFHDIGTPADLLQTSLELAAADGRADRPRWGHDVVVDPSARVTRSVLWDRVRIGAHATIHECVVADGVEIPDGANYARAAIVQHEGQLIVTDL
jgi:NDP-sugar pyrophosphorylase family protein